MSRLAGFFFLITAAVAALGLFHIKQEVRELEKELGLVHRGILRHQEAVQVLNTEWSYLNRPARIATLSARYLGLRPLTAAQVVQIDDLPSRTTRTSGAATKIAEITR